MVWNSVLPLAESTEQTVSRLYLLYSQVYAEYPDRPLFLHLYCTKPPSMNTQPTGINLAITGNVEVYVFTKENQLVFLFSLVAVSSSFTYEVNTELNLNYELLNKLTCCCYELRSQKMVALAHEIFCWPKV